MLITRVLGIDPQRLALLPLDSARGFVGEVVKDAGDGGILQHGGAHGASKGGIHGHRARGHAVHRIDGAQNDRIRSFGGAERNQDDRKLPDLAVVAGLVR